ncbi:bifunctional diguanylate cyclase/phosphodiesterase [Thalassobaculum sp.]|uniref:putative bifunctional diguanylate cyclase/phosphodiesterase n=1 Tax=Thalassobaculum sp. TaxID=2022740 RepID=UPI0032EB2681
MVEPTIQGVLDTILHALPWLLTGTAVGALCARPLWAGVARSGRTANKPSASDTAQTVDVSARETLHHRLETALEGMRDDDGAPALVVLNFDNFRFVNDGFGHTTGDAVLAEAAKRIRGALRHSDTSARIGGDEFLVLLQSTGGAAPALVVAERLRATVSQPYDIDGKRFQLSASVGIALAPRHGRTAAELTRSATAAMSAIKRRGGDSVELPTVITTSDASERLRLEAELRQALERGEFELHYQPKFTLANGTPTLIGAEALLRWDHPERGLMPPAAFMQIAEETGLIVPIGDWVLQESLKAVKRWNSDASSPGTPLTVAVNLSFKQFDRVGFFEFVRDSLHDAGVQPSLLELELTESMVMHNPDNTVGVMRRLRSLGVRFSIDDFGTGHSSLGLLKRLPVQSVKIDRSFMQDVPVSDDDTAIALAILGLAHTLGMEVVAEGVETESQLAFLRVRGCDAVQGFLLGRPMPEAEFRSTLERTARPTESSSDLAAGMPLMAAAVTVDGD